MAPWRSSEADHILERVTGTTQEITPGVFTPGQSHLNLALTRDLLQRSEADTLAQTSEQDALLTREPLTVRGSVHAGTFQEGISILGTDYYLLNDLPPMSHIDINQLKRCHSSSRTSNDVAGPVSVVALILTYNRRNAVKRCLEAVFKQTRVPDEVRVIDNGSTDGTVEMIKAKFAGVELVPLKENLADAARVEEIDKIWRRGFSLVWILDDGAVPECNALESLLVEAGNGAIGDGVAALASVQVTGRETYQMGGKWKHRVIGLYARRNGKSPSLRERDVDLTSFCGMLLKRGAIQTVGVPRRDYYFTFMDYEYCLRIRRNGLRICMIPSSVIYHEFGEAVARKSIGLQHIRIAYPAWRSYYHARNHIHTAIYLLHNPLVFAYA